MGRDLDVRHCRVLVAVHDHGGVAAAARALRLAQSTVSETLLSLQRVIGAPVVLRRQGREARLTSAGEALLPHARILISASEAALAALASSGDIIRLGTVESVTSFLLPEPLRAFRHAWPNADVRISIGLCEDLRRRVHGGELDAALTVEGMDRVVETIGRSMQVIAPTQLNLVAAPANPLCGGTAGRAELRARTFLFADPGGAFDGLLRAWFAGSAQDPKFESAGSIDGVKRGVLNSEAIGVLPAYAVAEELSSGSLIALQTSEALPAIALISTTAAPMVARSPIFRLMESVAGAVRPPGKAG